MRERTVFVLKLVHAVIFLMMVAAMCWIFYAAVARRYDWILVAALGLICLEGIALIFNRLQCPITTLVKKYSGADVAVSDIFLPGWCVRYTFPIATTIFIIELALLARGYFIN